MLQSYNFICSIHWTQYLFTVKVTFMLQSYNINFIHWTQCSIHWTQYLFTVNLCCRGYIYAAEVIFMLHNFICSIHWKQYLFTVKFTFMLQSYNFICSIHWTQYLFTVKLQGYIQFHMLQSCTISKVIFIQFIWFVQFIE